MDDPPLTRFPKTERVSEDYPAEWNLAQVVVTEKLDGANCAVSFGEDGGTLLQSRGHYLRGGWRERQFDLFKRDYSSRRDMLEVLGARYVLFGEWLYAKHRVFYDALPAYFVQYDVFDREERQFLSTDRRRQLVGPLGIPEAPELHRGAFRRMSNAAQFIGPSRFKTRDWRERYDGPEAGTDMTDLMEGVYVRLEHGGRVVGRRKLPRPEFEKVRSDDDNWHGRPIVRNLLRGER